MTRRYITVLSGKKGHVAVLMDWFGEDNMGDAKLTHSISRKTYKEAKTEAIDWARTERVKCIVRKEMTHES